MQDIILVAADSSEIRFACRAASKIHSNSRIQRRIRFFKLRRNPPGEEQCLSVLRARKSGVAIFISHGDPENIFGAFERNDNRVTPRRLVNYPATYGDLQGLAVLAISCSTAKVLGRKSVANRIVPVYYGFDQTISWSEVPDDKFKTYLAKCLVETISAAIENHSSFDQFGRDLQLNLVRSIKTELGEESIHGKAVWNLIWNLNSSVYCEGDLRHTF